MPIKYQKVWDALNSLETVTSKICSAREILDSAVDRLQEHQYDKVETLLYAVDEFLQYYLQEFDEKFKDAWQATVGDLRDDVKDDGMRPWGHSDLEYLIANNKKSLICDKDDPSPECQNAWNDFWEEHYHPEEHKDDKVVKRSLPVEIDSVSGEYYVTFPDDLLEATNLKEGDQVEWVDLGNGSFKLIKKEKKEQPSWVKGNELAKVKTYQEMIDDGWEMTDDGFWIKEN